MECTLGLEYGIPCKGNVSKVIELEKSIQLSFTARLSHLGRESTSCEHHASMFLTPNSRSAVCKGPTNHKTYVKSDRHISLQLYLEKCFQNKALVHLVPGTGICRPCELLIKDGPDRFQKLNDIFEKCGLDKLNVGRVVNPNSVRLILETKVQEMFKKVVELSEECGVSISLKFSNNPEQKLLKEIGMYVKGTNSKYKKLHALTVHPEGWTAEKIQNEFGVGRKLACKAVELKSENGIFAHLEPKRGTGIPEEVRQYAIKFYRSDEISRCLPGLKDSVTINKVKLTKRLLYQNLSESYQLYKLEVEKSGLDKHYDIGKSSFFALRPKEVIPAAVNGIHNVCICTLHGNLDLISQSLKQDRKYCLDLLKLLVCDSSNANCMLDRCPNCKKGETRPLAIMDKLKTDAVGKLIQFPLTIHQWTKVDRAELVHTELNLTELGTKLLEQLSVMRAHHFIMKTQAQNAKDLRASVKPGELVCHLDFAEKYTTVVQNEPQMCHWSHDNVIILPLVFHFKDTEGKNVTKSGAIISDAREQDKYLVFALQKTGPDLV